MPICLELLQVSELAAPEDRENILRRALARSVAIEDELERSRALVTFARAVRPDDSSVIAATLEAVRRFGRDGDSSLKPFELKGMHEWLKTEPLVALIRSAGLRDAALFDEAMDAAKKGPPGFKSTVFLTRLDDLGVTERQSVLREVLADELSNWDPALRRYGLVSLISRLRDDDQELMNEVLLIVRRMPPVDRAHCLGEISSVAGYKKLVELADDLRWALEEADDDYWNGEKILNAVASNWAQLWPCHKGDQIAELGFWLEPLSRRRRRVLLSSLRLFLPAIGRIAGESGLHEVARAIVAVGNWRS